VIRNRISAVNSQDGKCRYIAPLLYSLTYSEELINLHTHEKRNDDPPCTRYYLPEYLIQYLMYDRKCIENSAHFKTVSQLQECIGKLVKQMIIKPKIPKRFDLSKIV